MTPNDFKKARNLLGLSVNEMALRLRLSLKNGGDRVRGYESGKEPITGPVAAAVFYMCKVEGIEI